MIADLGFRIWDLSLRPWRGHGSASIHNPQSAIRNLKSPPRGISLMEVLISMFVLLFGLMGVAAIFPVGNHYVIEGEKYDLGQLMAENAFEELQARGILRPELWWYSDDAGEVNTVTGTTLFIQPSGAANPGYFNADPIQGSGHAFVIDPLGTANGAEVHFPSEADIKSNLSPWNPPPSGPSISGTLWPVRRMTLPIPDPNNPGFPQKMTTAVAETIFRLRDDLAVEMPERDDVPSIQRWVTADIDNNGNANNTPNDPNDDTLLTDRKSVV